MKKLTLPKDTTIEIDDATYEKITQALAGKPSKNWRAEIGRRYWYLDHVGSFGTSTEIDDSIENFRYTTGNYYRTKEEAEKYTEYLLAVGTVTRAINDLNGNWEADWKDGNQCKCTIYFNYDERGHYISSYTRYRLLSILPFCKDEQTAQTIIDTYPKELEIIREYKK